MLAIARWLVVLLVAFGMFGSPALAAKKKSKSARRKAALMKRFDANRDGQLSRVEKAAMREAIAKQREKKALARNAAVLNGSL